MLSLLRNPLLSLLGRLWWLPALTLIVATFGVGGEDGLRVASVGAVAYLSAIAGIVGTAWAYGAWSTYRERARHRTLRHRFLCPHCLNFGGYHFACGACGGDIEAFIVHTDGAYVNNCPHCNEPLFSRERVEGRGIQARCEWCQDTCDRSIHHERQVRVLAALLPADHASLGQTITAQESQAQGRISHAFDDGVALTYVLNLSRPSHTAHSLPRTHAFWAVESVWLDAPIDDPQKLSLELGQAADQFIREAGLTDTQRRALTAYVRQAALPPPAQNVLETRFGAVKYGVAAAKLPYVID
jgi:hypothetical protein